MFALWGQRAVWQKSLTKEESSEMYLENLNISKQNFLKLNKREGFQNGTLSEICSKIDLEREISIYLIVCAIPVHIK